MASTAQASSPPPPPPASTCSSPLLPPVVEVPTVTLANGVEMPQIAAGMAFLDVKHGFYPEAAYRSMALTLEAGLRHIDTALIYRTHRAIGQVLGSKYATGELTREEVFLTTKVFHGEVPNVSIEGTVLPLDSLSPQEVSLAITRQFEQSLDQLGVGYVDLMLLHWPAAFNSQDPLNPARRLAAWRVLETMLQRGWARAIGVSNFSEEHLKRLVEDGARIPPMVNQIEASPYLQFDNIIHYCKKHGIVLQAYSPLGNGSTNMLEDPVINDIASKHGRNPGQIVLRYLVQLGFALVTRSSSLERMRSNLEIFKFELDEGDMARLRSLKRENGTWGLPTPYTMT